MSGNVTLDVAGGVATLTIDNPARRNAFDQFMWGRAGDLMEVIAQRGDVRVVILTGAGEHAFCAGNDISELGEARATATGAARYDAAVTRFHAALRDCPRPVVARIRGACIGGGFEVAQLCDLQVAAVSARFGVTPARLGLGYRLQDVELLVSRVGARAARELLLTGRLVDGAEAARMGLVTRVVADDDLDATVAGYAADLAANAPLTMAAVKACVRHLEGAEDAPDADRCRALVDACNASEDFVEGRRAFAEKRRPRFHGR